MHKTITILCILSILLVPKTVAMNAPTQSTAQGTDVNSNGIRRIRDKHFEVSQLKNAVEYNQFDIALMLLEAGADPNENNYDWEPSTLYSAIKKGNDKMVQLLLSYGADPFKIHHKDRSAFFYFRSSIVEIIIARMLEFPNHDLSARIITFLCYIKRAYTKDVGSFWKKHFVSIIKSENKQLLKDKIWVREGKIPMDSQLAYDIIAQRCPVFEEIIQVKNNKKFLEYAFTRYGK